MLWGGVLMFSSRLGFARRRRESGEFTPILYPGTLILSAAYGAEVERGVRSRTGSIGDLTGALRSPAADLMMPGAAGATIPRIGPRPQSLRLSDTYLVQ